MSQRHASSVLVEICGRTYQIVSKDDTAYVQNLAKMVHEKMKMVEDSTQTIDSLRVAVLTALNFADESHKLRAYYETRIKSLEQERRRLSDLIERTLQEDVKKTPA